jgi:predicted dehydrogenase
VPVIRAAVVGAGRIGQHHLACLQALAGVELAAVCDRSAALAELAAERFNVPQYFQDFGEMLDSVGPTVVHVATPPRSHFALAMETLEAGAHAFVEKPITSSYDELTALAEKASERGLHVIENFSTLFYPEVLTVQGLVDAGVLGEVVHVDVFLCRQFSDTDPYIDPNAVHETMALPLGPIEDWLPHLASLANKFVGKHKQVVGTSLTKSPGSRLPYDEFRAYIQAERGTAALAFSANIQPDTYTLQVAGTRARATVNMFEARLTLERRWPCPKPLNPLVNGLVESYQVQRSSLISLARKLGGSRSTHLGVWQHIEETYAALSSGRTPPVSLAQVLDTNRLVSDIVSTAVSA